MRCRKSPAAVFGVFALASLTGAAGQEAPQLPDAPGKDTVKKVCATCHEIETVIGSRRTRIGWQQSVDDMVGRGAEGSEEEMAAVVDYLATYFGKVNVNTAAAQDLEKMLGLSGEEARAIIGYREQHTKIKDFEELRSIPGVSAEKLQAKRGLIVFSL